MGEAVQRECWFNVYPQVHGARRVGLPHWTEASADKSLNGRRATAFCLNAPAFRIHVRLKPEGAPKRYASEDERFWWEHQPEFMRGLSDSLRTPKIEESAT
jgi:hypothetical protein